MAEMAALFSKENPVFATFVVYGAALFLKMMFVVFTTIYYRTTKQVQANPEDVKLFDPTGKKELQIVLDDPDVERTLRCHRNDLENIVPFLILGLLYITTNPEASCAITLFRVFTGARFAHTVVYLGGIRQPLRALCFLANACVNVYMAVEIITHYM